MIELMLFLSRLPFPYGQSAVSIALQKYNIHRNAFSFFFNFCVLNHVICIINT